MRLTMLNNLNFAMLPSGDTLFSKLDQDFDRHALHGEKVGRLLITGQIVATVEEK